MTPIELLREVIIEQVKATQDADLLDLIFKMLLTQS